MNVLLTVSDWAGHYFCMVPLGWALRCHGHDVRVACSPRQAAAVAASGLIPVPVLDGPDMMEASRHAFYLQTQRTPELIPDAPLPLNPRTGLPGTPEAFSMEEITEFRERAVAATQRSYDNAVEFAAYWRPDLVLHDLIAMEGALVAALHAVAGVYVSPGFIGTVETEPGLDLVAGDPLSCFHKYGIDWSRDQIAYAVDPSPETAVPPMGGAQRIPVRYTPYNGSGGGGPRLETTGEQRRVCIVWGNSAGGIFGTGAPALRHVIDAALAQGAEVVLTAGARQVETLGPLPQGVHVLRDCPLELLLPHSDVLVHHGSANCLMNGIAAGVPQLSIAMNFDTLVYGRRIEPSGAVYSLPGIGASVRDVHAALEAVLNTRSYAKAAEVLRDGVNRAPSVADVAGQLITLARTGTLPVSTADVVRETA